MEVTLVEVLRALARDRRPCAAVPEHHRAAAIFALGDSAFEGGITQRMVFGAHCEAFDRRVEARPLGDRPALEQAVHFQAEVPVEPGCIVLLNHEAVAARRSAMLARRLGGTREIAFGVVVR